MMLFAAVHESAFGPKRTSRNDGRMSAFGGKADIDQLWSIDLNLWVHALATSLSFPNDLISHADQAARLETGADALELLARALGVAVQHAADVEFLAPSGERHDDGSGGQLKVCR